jgi:hypothetical protein
VKSGREDAGLPVGTRVEGVVRQAIPARGNEPGVLDMDFRRVIYPDGESQSIDASLISLDARSIKRTESGRLVASVDKSKDRLQWIGIGAGAGFILSKLTRGNLLQDILLGAGAGYLFNEFKKDKPGDVNLKAGTEFGVRLDRQVTVYTNDDRERTRPASEERYSGGDRDREYDVDIPAPRRERDRWDREDEAPYSEDEIGVMIDDRNVRFNGDKPFVRGGVVFVPLEPVARTARIDYRYDASRRMIRMRNGEVRVSIDSRIAIVNGERRRLNAAPELRSGTVYVPMEFLAFAANGTVYRDRASNTVVVLTERY